MKTTKIKTFEDIKGMNLSEVIMPENLESFCGVVFWVWDLPGNKQACISRKTGDYTIEDRVYTFDNNTLLPSFFYKFKGDSRDPDFKKMFWFPRRNIYELDNQGKIVEKWRRNEEFVLYDLDPKQGWCVEVWRRSKARYNQVK